MNKQELLKQLQLLAEKWKGKVPKDNTREYWQYRVDKCKAIRLKFQLDNLTVVPEMTRVLTNQECLDLYA